MNPEHSKEQFCNRLAEQSLALGKLNAAQGFEAMLAFYEECRADGCDIEDDGDMLLCQWGASDDEFVWNITRQFITPDEDEPYQLSLTFRFDSSAELVFEQC